jgi:manganese oxidase
MGAAAVGSRLAKAAPTPAPTVPAPAPTSPLPVSPTLPSPTGRNKTQPSRITVPNGSVLPFRVRNGVKIFHLVAEPVTHEITPGLTITAWGYNGTTPGPVMEVNQGDRVRIYVTNKLPEVTTIHWHGVLLPNGMDGIAGLTQPPIEPGQTFKYEFTFKDAGTFMYHPHADEMTQIALGMVGMIVVHPRNSDDNLPAGRKVRDYCLMTHEWKIPIGTKRPDPMAMNDFNVLTFNSRAYPGTEPLIAQTGDLVRLRFGNLGPMDHHPIHIHGHTFQLTQTDGGDVPRSARFPTTTVLVPTGTVRVVEFIASAPGDWPLHCHMTHHAMNQMGHSVANLVGANTRGLTGRMSRAVPGTMIMGHNGMAGMDEMNMDQPTNSVSMRGGKGPFGWIEMGGMFTIVKVRDNITDDKAAAASWYNAPAGTVSSEASADEMKLDGVTL